MKELADYIYRYFPEEMNHIITIADQVCRQYFTFTSKWDLEQAPYPVEFDGPVDWEVNPNGDPEFVWQFNRHRFFLCLGQAYAMTGDEKYAQKLVELLLDWIRRVPLTAHTRQKAWRSLEAGFRGEYWTKAVSCIQKSPAFTADVREIYEKSLLEHSAYLKQCHNTYKYISNWGVIENHGLFEIAVHLRDKQKGDCYAKLALEHLQQAADIQFMGDGVHWEQSPMYHCEVVRCYLDVLLIAAHKQIKLPAGMEETVKKALYAMLAWKKPDSHMFLNGDSDDLDMRECFILGACYFKDEVLKYAADGIMDGAAAWNLGMTLGGSQGMKAIGAYEKWNGQEPDFLSKAFPDSGHFYLRSGWDKAASLAHFTCGTLGAGHGHSDKLHVDLVLEGRDVLVDAGRFTYQMEHGRTGFKDPQAHNTSILDGKPFIVCKDSWECTKLSQPVNTAWHFTSRYGYAQGGHLGYIEDGVFFNRRLIHIMPDIYIIADEMYGTGSHTCETFFHFHEAGTIEVTGQYVLYRDTAGEAAVRFYSEGFAEGTAAVSCQTSWISRHYNEKVQNPCVKVCRKTDGFSSLYTVISPADSIRYCEKIPAGSALKGISYQPKQAEALHIAAGRSDYILIICHEEVNSPTDMVSAGNCLGFGNVILFDRIQETMGGTVLHW